MALRFELQELVPQLPTEDARVFEDLYRSVGDAAKAHNDIKHKQETDEERQAAASAEEGLEAAQQATLSAALPLLATVDSCFDLPWQEHHQLLFLQCAIITQATPKGLARFIVSGFSASGSASVSQEESSDLIESLLLKNEILMRDMLEAGGAKGFQYGKAMTIFNRILASSPAAAEAASATFIKKPSEFVGAHQTESRYDEATILYRLALGTALEHAVPMTYFDRPMETVDPVDRFLHYQNAYEKGELDPLFPYMTVWECRYITNSDAPNEELQWGRDMLRNYRPDHVLNNDYAWKYVMIVRTEVRYKVPEWTGNGVHRSYPQLLQGGGKCGPRAWFGRFILKAFGIPTWGVRQRGHAALTHWMPTDWTINLGAHWRWNWWEGQSGLDFYLDAQARRSAKEYEKVLFCQWIGEVLDEERVHQTNLGTGGIWSALGYYQKKRIVNDKANVSDLIRRRKTDTNNHDAIIITLEEQTRARILHDEMIEHHDNGSIFIPASAFIGSERRRRRPQFTITTSFSGGKQLICPIRGENEAAVEFQYEFQVPHAGAYILTALVVTINHDQKLFVVAASNIKESSNTICSSSEGATAVVIALPYTSGMWEQSPPVQISLVEGTNVLRFTRPVPHLGLAIKHFFLVPVPS